RLARAAQGERGDQSDEQDRVDRALAVRALHQMKRFVGDDRRARHVRNDRAEIADEALGPFAVPDVDTRVYLQEKPAAVAYQLRAKLLRHVGEPDRLGREVVLQTLEAPHEVPVDLILKMGQRRRAHLRIGLADLDDQSAEILGDELELGPYVALGRLVARDDEAALERL